MTKNLANWDRILRIVAGLILLGWPLAWYGPENITPWGYIGLIPFVTGLLGTCPLYRVFGWSTKQS
ncbi:MAG: DUF2892 domain-containing protein [Hyphomicrobium sp.]|nr:DUF2892 domain-containing protein [Hyphomicrobium sp.]